MPNISCLKGTDHFCASCKNEKCIACYHSKNVDGICKPIETPIEFCSQYNEEDQCIYCKYGYYLQDGVCLKTSLKNCFTHHIEDPSKCGVCNGFVLKSNGQCDETRKCTVKHCKSCMIEEEKELCLWCNDEYILSHKDKYTCIQARGFLKNCFSQNSSGRCVTCRYGFYIDPTKEGKLTNCIHSELYNGFNILKSLLVVFLLLILS